MTLNGQQWLMIAIVIAFFVGLYLWTSREGDKLDRRSGPRPGE